MHSCNKFLTFNHLEEIAIPSVSYFKERSVLLLKAKKLELQDMRFRSIFFSKKKSDSKNFPNKLLSQPLKITKLEKLQKRLFGDLKILNFQV